MGKTKTRLELARRAYREALEAACSGPSQEAWERLLAAGKELSSAQEPRERGRRRGHREPAAPVDTVEGEALPDVDRLD